VIVAVAGIGEGRVGQGEDEAAVAHAVAVHHVFGDPQRHAGEAGPDLVEADVQELRGAVVPVHLAADGFGQGLGILMRGHG
jgi:hypothetical protein